MLLVIYRLTDEGYLYAQHHLRLQVKGVYLAWYLFVQALYFPCSLYMASVARDLHFMADFPQTPAHTALMSVSLSGTVLIQIYQQSHSSARQTHLQPACRPKTRSVYVMTYYLKG